MQKWIVESDPARIRRLGKLIEELSECINAASRCLIQGPDALNKEGRTNLQWLADELADVRAQVVVTIDVLKVDHHASNERTVCKIDQMYEWEKLYK